MHYIILFLSCLCTLFLIGHEKDLEALVAIENHIAQQKTTLPSPSSLEDSPPHDLQAATTSYETAFFKMLFVLAAILIVVALLFFVLKKLSSSRMQQSNHFRSIKILEKRAISPKSMLYLIEIGGKKLLLAESQLEIRPISTLDWIENTTKGL